jgi:hypothetical protein
MSIYFGFSDECGDYQPVRGKRFVTSHPYYIRATFIMDASEWKELHRAFITEKIRHKIPIGQEIKWSYLWSVYKHHKNREPIPKEKPYSFLATYSIDGIIDFISAVLSLVEKLHYKKMILTITQNDICPKIQKHALFKMHFQDIMQRIQMELQEDKNNLCVLFIDPVSMETDKALREAYHQILTEGDFITEYSSIKDSLSIEFSHHSVGIQIADFIAGSFNGLLRSYKRSSQIFRENVQPYLRKGPDGNIFGYGIREIPKNDKVRINLHKKIYPF